MGKIAPFMLALLVGIITASCMDQVRILSDAGVSITLSDSTVILCKGTVSLEAPSMSPEYLKFTQIRCADNRGVHQIIPAKKVVKIEILGVKKE
ncbi:MAG: hypothetical protein HYY60_01520 [Parcubacteria group bacterium]|nr:hypothetical protein [Parcubacteria group bacterium]MBI3075008.1 hypothetical protein [Parcubacteria group bacterium]